MLILAIETATDHASVVALEDGRELAAWREVTHQDLCQRLAFEVRGVLATAGRGSGDIGLIAVGLGPGSFTSVRVGLATAKGFAFARGLPIVGVSSLEAMAWRQRGGLPGLVCPVLDAKRGELYAAIFRQEECRIERVAGECVISAADLLTRLAGFGEPVAVIGEPDRLLPADLKRLGDLMYPGATWPDAAGIADLGLRRYNAGGADDIGPLRPIYVRMSYAEESRKLDLGLR